MRRVDQGSRNAETDERLAGCDEIRVAGTVAGARPCGDAVVLNRRCPFGVLCSDGKDIRVVGRVVELRAAEPGVATRYDDDDALAPCGLGSVGERVDLVVLHAVGAERKVEHPDGEPVGVAMLDDPVDACNDLRDVRSAGPVADLDGHDPRARSDPGEALAPSVALRPGRVLVKAGDQPGHIRPMTVLVQVPAFVLLRVE